MSKTDVARGERSFPYPRANPLDPPAEYARFREEAPLTKITLSNGRHAWLVTRFEDVKAVMASPHASASPFTSGYPFISPRREATVKAYRTFLVMDPPEHTKYRRMLTGEFTHKRMEHLRPEVEALVDRLIDGLLANGPPADLVEMLTQRVPVTVISSLLGVSHDDDDKLLRWSLDHLGLTGDPAIAIDANRNMLAYFDELLTRMTAAPVDAGKDMLSRLAANIQSGNLDHMDAVRLAWQMYFAGADTTANTLALGTLSFLLDPQQRAKLVAEPALLGNAVEEILRYHAAAHLNVARAAAADIPLGNEVIPKGDGIYALNNAAGRDPAVFEAPDRFDIGRPNAEDHLSFGYGIHQCIGQPLARLELRTVFGKLFQRIPDLRLAVPFEELRFKESMQVYGLHSLPVTW